MAKTRGAKAPVRFRSAAELLRQSPIVITESQTEFDRISDALEQEIEPDGIIERVYVTDMAHYTWEILRLRRCKAQIINANLHVVIVETIGAILDAGDLPKIVKAIKEGSHDPEKVGRKDPIKVSEPIFLGGEGIAEYALQMIDVLGLDATIIEAQAVRRSFADIAQLERLLASLEARRDKALRRIAEYRAELSQVLRECSDRIIEGKVIALKGASIKKPPTAA